MKEATMADITDIQMAEPVTAKPLVVQQASAVVSTPTPADLLRHALDSGADLDRLERLMDMQIKWEANEARKAYHLAMAQFKKNPPTIIKDKHVSFDTSKGRTEYDHATLGEVCEKIVAALAEHDFSHRWIPGRADNGGMKVTCVLTHKLGHSEETELEAPHDQSGGKNSIQAMSSTVTYLQRYSLLAAVGLAAKDAPDDDGRGADGRPTADDVWAKWETELTSAGTVEDVRRVRALAGSAFQAIGDVASWNQFKVMADKKKAELEGGAK
ncbi:ERF family protein [Paraburkholderia tropica]|uniref:ERF family protein n=1 Tax=Paraburkholderia tropica TaxID=92647 RepID=UPI002AB64FA9|nr:ERF family protein [Paraburkholderia tropica]